MKLILTKTQAQLLCWALENAQCEPEEEDILWELRQQLRPALAPFRTAAEARSFSHF